MRSSITRFLMLTALGALAFAYAPVVAAQALAPEPPFHKIQFPVDGRVSYSDDWGAPRAGGKTHQGNDLMGTKLEREVAAADGVIRWVRVGDVPTKSNMLALKADDGWEYYYIHINNDTPGTDDGANPAEWRFAPGIEQGARVAKGQFIAYMGDSGDAEGTGPHLHFEVHEPDGTPVDPYTSLRLAQGLSSGNRCAYDASPDRKVSDTSARGYWTLGTDGGMFTYGDATFYGSTGGIRLNKPIVGMAALPQGDGYWIVASDGGIFAFGNAVFHGSTGGIKLAKPIVGMTATPSGEGYWMVASDGGIFAFGDATFLGSTGAIALAKPIVGMTATPTGLGYWLVASDGGIFSFGDAKFFGSTGAIALTKPIVGMAATPSKLGYWLVARDGGIFGFGDATYYGALPALGLCKWPEAVGIVSTASGKGYWIQATDGSVVTFGDAKPYGDPSELGVQALALATVATAQN